MSASNVIIVTLITSSYHGPIEVNNFYAYLFCVLFFFYFIQECDNLWWDSFATEFFEDDASLTLAFCLEDGPKRYSMFIL